MATFKKQVEFGGCYDTDRKWVDRCTADEVDCVTTSSSFPYLSHHDVIQQHAETGHPPSFCQPEYTFGGLCENNDMCVPNAFSCSKGFRPDDLCNMMFHTRTHEATIYGGCVNQSTNEVNCVWSPTDCGVFETFYSADELLAKGKPCFCHDVNTGMCRQQATSSTQGFCAVQPTSCGPNEEWISAKVLKENAQDFDHVECRVCKRFFPTVVIPDTPAVSPSTTWEHPVKQPSSDRGAVFEGAVPMGTSGSMSATDIEGPSNVSKSSKSNGGAIAGSVIGILALLLIVAFVVLKRRRDRNNHQHHKELIDGPGATTTRVPPTNAFQPPTGLLNGDGFQDVDNNDGGFQDIQIDVMPDMM